MRGSRALRGSALVAATLCPRAIYGGSGSPASPVVDVPGGTMTVGGSIGIEDEQDQPGPPVTVGPFAIDRLEVTVRDYVACVTAKVCPPIPSESKTCNINRSPARPDHPMNCATWGVADTFCKWKGGRLPTSAEWERAARGDTNRKYPWGDEPPKNQLCWENEKKGTRHTCPVGAHPTGASPLGVLDLAGNVAEWTSTRSHSVTGLWYVIRGGGFTLDDMAMANPDALAYRVQKESDWDAQNGAMDLGFRCVKGGSAPAEPPVAVAQPIVSPSPGSVDRKPMLDAIRAGAKLTSQFKVDWLKQAGDWAYFEGREHHPGSPAPSPVHALIHRNPDGQWKAVEVLVETPGQDENAKRDFRRRLQTEIARSKLPAGLFPGADSR